MPNDLLIFPASFAQESLWFLDRMIPDRATYNIPQALRIKGILNTKSLLQALEEIVNRHESLRTTFELMDESPVQVISEKGSIAMPVIDLSTLPETDNETEFQRLVAQDAQQPFDLTHGSLLRTTLIRLTQKEHVLLVTMHHIISDGWSMGIFVRELSVLYEAFSAGKPSPLSDLPLQYADFSNWQREWLAGEVSNTQLSYWKHQLAHLPVLQLFTDRKRSVVRSPHGATQSFALSPELSASLKALSRQEGVTLFMTLLAAFQTLLHRYTRQDDIVVGSPIANRNSVETEELIGFFINTLVLRTDISGNPSFRELLARVRQVTLEAYAHQDLPFEKLVKELQPERNLSQTPLFQVMFVLQNTPIEEFKLPDVEFSTMAVYTNTAKFDLTFGMSETETGLTGLLEYSTDLFDACTIHRMVEHFQTLLEGIVANPDRHISKLPLLTATEQHQLLLKWNQTQVNYPKDQCIHQLFEAQVEKNPDAIALVFEDKQLTYRELNQRANKLARYLQKLGVGTEMLVGICVERSLEMVVGILAILKAGGAYVPLDPAYPQERLSFILSDTNTPVLLTQQKLVENLPTQGAHLVCLDAEWEQIAQQSDENPVSGVAGENLAYVIYTSGSTGKPKGVTINHSNVVRLLKATHSWFNFNEDDIWTLFHSYAFDFSVWEIWGALLYGGRLVVVPFWVSRSPETFYELLQSQKVTVLNQTPSAFRQLIRAEEEAKAPAQELALRLVIFGGEALELRSLAPWFERHGSEHPQLVNMYGITETTVHVTYRPLTKDDLEANQVSPIGCPIPDLQIYLLDKHLNPVPFGVPGEIYVGGAGLARGYLNRLELTAERFIPNPFSREPGERMYKTGDLARYLPNGNIEYLGRIDEQVKIRGFRIELGEIEAVLVQHPDVRETAVIVREDKPGDKRLVAYVIPNQEHPLSINELRLFLKDKLPNFMVPSAIVLLDVLPLTPNGKLARQALPAPDQARPELSEAYVAPRNLVEEALAAIWSEVLGIEKIGIHDNFFALGGDSILTIRVVALAKERGINVSLPQIFQHQTIGYLAQALEINTVNSTAITRTEPFSLLSPEDRQKLPVDIEDAYPMTMLQQGMIYHMELTPELPRYHNVDSFLLRASFDFKAFQEAVQRVINRHAILRTSFSLTAYSEPLQLVHQFATLPLQVEDLRHLAAHEQDKIVVAYMESEKRRCFNFAQPPLLRFCIHRRTDDTFQFTLTECHPIFDGWSLTSTLAEILKSYSVLLNQETLPIEPPPTISFRDFVLQERMVLQSEVCQHYWNQKLSDATLLSLPRLPDSLRSDSSQEIGDHYVSISTELFERLKQVAQLTAVPLKSVFLAAHLKVMGLISGQADILTGLVSNGRSEEMDGEQVRGLFLNTVPFRLKLSEGTWLDLIKETFKAEVELLPFRRYPTATLQKNWGSSPLLNTLFNFINFHSLDLFSQLSNVELLELTASSNPGNYKLEISFSLNQRFWREENAPLRVLLQFDTNELSFEQVETIGGYYTKVLNQIAAEPFSYHNSQCLLSASEQHKLLVEWNSDQPNYPQDKCIHQLFEAQVERTPDAVAVMYENQQLTYQQLNCRANQLAHYLQSVGVGSNVLVGLCVERSLEMVVGLLGILKAGGAYVPLDPNYPQERLSYMLEDSSVQVLLTHRKWISELSQHQAQVICLDSDWEKIALYSQENPTRTNKCENLAYIIYTSGSTGKSKGVMITHQALSRFTQTALSEYEITPSDRVLQFASINFDVAVEEIYPCLCIGATLVLRTDEMLADLRTFFQACRDLQLTVLDLPTAYWHQLVANLAFTDVALPESLRLVIIGGEKVLPQPVRHWLQYVAKSGKSDRLQLINAYGPTETTVSATLYRIPHSTFSTEGEVPIGRPLAHLQAYILDPHLQLVPIGVSGELYIGGDSLARGYLNRPELTSEKFIPNPFCDSKSQRLYKTGDLARHLNDGNIEFLGRIDHQVKIRGFRIELGEIEAVLNTHPQIQQTVVIATEDIPANKRLVAYVVSSDESLTTNQIREFLKQKLPEYMVPSAFVTLDTLPLTPNGKVDRFALPAPNGEITREHEYVAPRTAIEQILTNIWQELLLKEKVSIHDNFFEIGGDSILSIQVVSRAKNSGIQITPKQIFQNQTIASLARVANTTVSVECKQGIVTGVAPLTPIQHWFFAQNTQELHHYNQSFFLQIPNDIKPELLEKAVEKLLKHHDALRLRFTSLGSEHKQINHGLDDTVPFTFVDLSSTPKLSQPQALEKIAIEYQASLNLSIGPIMQVVMFNLGDEDARLLIIIHHIAVDGVSWRILLSDLETVYQQLIAEQPLELGAKTTAFIDWAKKLKNYAQSEIIKQELDYWINQPWKRTTPLPLDYAHTQLENTVDSAAQVSVKLSVEETHALLLSVNEAYNTQINHILLSALVVSLAEWTGNSTVVIDLEGHGREEIFEDVDLSRTVGWFTSLFPVLLQLPSLNQPAEVIKSIKEQLQAIPNRGIGCGILRYLCEDTTINQQLQTIPTSEICFNYLGQFDQVKSQTRWKFAPESTGANHSSKLVRDYLLEINCLVVEGELKIDWTYSSHVHTQATVENLAKSYIQAIRSIIEHCQSEDVYGYTPSDFPLAQLNQLELDELLEQLQEN
ncbi:amino acid adenylation domain-containing protein [uncultured Nostoc sp.]|uniref:amino acid adenylation domain-containing protein n=1 Tax=uncultured Nostoc sp. TaxID=340711 RepID=UPI0035CBFD40